jgi:hypothetical protein
VPGLGPYPITYNLKAGMNMVSLPIFNHQNITKASELLDEVPYCTAVYRWSPEASCTNPPGFDAYFDISDPGEDFFVKEGHGYWVNVTRNSTWTY